MTLTISSTQASAIAADGETNNPLVTWIDSVNRSGTTLASGTGVLTDGALANAANWSTADFWRPDITSTSTTYRITRSADFTVNFMGVAAHNLANFGASARPQYSTDGGSTWLACDGIAATAITSNENIGFYFSNIEAADFRLSFSGLTAGDAVRVGVVYIGRALQFPRRMFAGVPPPLEPTIIDIQSNVTEGANFVATNYQSRGITMPLNIRLMDQDYIRGTGSAFPDFRRWFNQGKPFFMAWRPTAYPDDLIYGWREGDPLVPVNMGVKGYAEASSLIRAYDDKS